MKKEAMQERLEKIYTPQSYLDKYIVADKMEKREYKLKYITIADDDNMVDILIDGNHALEAAKKNNEIEKIELEKVSSVDHPQTVEKYVNQFGDLSNPISLIDGIELW